MVRHSNQRKSNVIMLKHAIKHRHVTPCWPRANGEIKRFMIPLTKVMITAKLEDEPYLSKVDNFLMVYWVTPHTITKVFPSEVMVNRKIRYTIPSVDDKFYNKVHNSLEKSDEIGQFKQRYYANRHCKTRTVEIGDKVLVLQTKQNKLTTKFNWCPYVVTEIKGKTVTAENIVNNNRVITDNNDNKRPFIKRRATLKEQEDLWASGKYINPLQPGVAFLYPLQHRAVIG